MSLHVAFVMPPDVGCVNPALPLVAELVRRGHRVTFASGPAALAGAGTAGARTMELPWPAEQSGGLTDARAGMPVLSHRLGQDWPDAICYDPATFVGPVLVQRLETRGVGLISAFAGNGKAADSQSHRLSAFAVENGVSADFFPVEGATAELNLVFTPREFQIAGDRFDQTYRFIGPSPAVRAQSEPWRPPAGHAPVLIISPGTAFDDRPEFYTMCGQAFGDTDWHVVMAVPAGLRAMQFPANFEVATYLPQPTVLSQAKAFLTHAGMCSVMEALYYEVPIVGVPRLPEQAANAERVAELGLGVRLDAVELTPQLLRGAVADVVADCGIRAELARFGERVRAGGGAPAGADALEAYCGPS